MKRISCILLCVILLIASSSAIADTREVGGDTVEEAVSRLAGFSFEENEMGMQTLMLSGSNDMQEYFSQSENQTVIMPAAIWGGGVNFKTIIIGVGGNELEQVQKVVIETDKMQYTITPEKPYSFKSEDTKIGIMWVVDENFAPVIEDMETSEQIVFDFIQDESSHKNVALNEEQLYMIHQYCYIVNKFVTSSDVNAMVQSLLMAQLAKSGYADYTISTTEK